MPGKGHFRARGENPHLRRICRVLRRQDKSRLGEIELGRNNLHLRARKPARIKHDGERIAAEFGCGEDVDGDEVDLHPGCLACLIKHSRSASLQRGVGGRLRPRGFAFYVPMKCTSLCDAKSTVTKSSGLLAAVPSLAE